VWTVNRLPLQPPRKSQRIKRLATLIDHHRGAPLRNRGNQPRRIGVQDCHITFGLSTLFRSDFHDLDRVEVLYPFAVALYTCPDLNVSIGTDPNEAKFHVLTLL